jgi:hypothetical protein
MGGTMQQSGRRQARHFRVDPLSIPLQPAAHETNL